MVFISKEVLERLKGLSCENVAKKLGMEVKHHRALCFIHSDQHPSLAFLGTKRNNWFCFVCNKGGNAIDLVCRKKNCTFLEACSWLCKEYSIDVSFTTKYESHPIIPTQKQFRVEDKKLFTVEVGQFLLDNSLLTDKARHFLFSERKLDLDVIQQLHIVSIDKPWDIIRKMKENFSEEILKASGLVSINGEKCYLRLFTPCLIFPYYDVEGNLIGLQSRYLGEKSDVPRFQFLSANKTHLFNLPILKTMNKGDKLYISEGITDCLALLSSKKKAVAIPSATILPEKDLIKLSKYQLFMYPDHDVAGEKAFATLQHFFIKQLCFLKRCNLPDTFKDYSDYYKNEIWKITK